MYIYVSTNQQNTHNKSDCRCNPGKCTLCPYIANSANILSPQSMMCFSNLKSFFIKSLDKYPWKIPIAHVSPSSAARKI